MSKKVDAMCPECGNAGFVSLTMVFRGKPITEAALPGAQIKLVVQQIPQLFCTALVQEVDDWACVCTWEQDGWIDESGYACFSELKAREGLS